jgi:hypothetical protein
MGRLSMASRYDEPEELPLLIDLSNGEEEIASAFLVLKEECARK